MRYYLNLRTGMKERLEELANQMTDWESVNQVPLEEQQRLAELIQAFQHCTSCNNLVVAGVDGSGEYPVITYEDSFVYFMIAQARCYSSEPLVGLKEYHEVPPLFDFVWLPADHERTVYELDQVFSHLTRMTVDEVINNSDYRNLKALRSGNPAPPASLHDKLIYPQASDSGNLAIQLRSTTELSAALALIKSQIPLDYILVDTTLSLPFVFNRLNSLFHEHLKRLCCIVLIRKLMAPEGGHFYRIK